MPDDAQTRYDRAVAMADRIREEWEREGMPLTQVGGSSRMPVDVPHVLVQMLRAAEHDCGRFARLMGSAHRGPKPSAVPEAEIGKSPAARLRAVSE